MGMENTDTPKRGRGRPRIERPPAPPPRSVGRPPVVDRETLQGKSLRLTPTQWAKFDDLGGVEWLRQHLNSHNL